MGPPPAQDDAEIENNPLEIKLNLEPLSFSSPGGYQLLKILDNTVALFKEAKYRTSEEIRNSQAILSQEFHHSEQDESIPDADGEEGVAAKRTIPVVTDDELIRYEETLFGISEASNRQLWLNNLRTDTDIFLIFAEWAERQRRKLFDPVLRNASLWDETLIKKQEAAVELTKLNQVFTMLKHPPNTGTPPGATVKQTEALRQKVRQMSLMAAINAADPKDELEQAILCLKLRGDRLKKIEQSIQSTRRLIDEGVQQQQVFLWLINELRSKWNVVKIPYENQVFNASDTDYPYRGELWIELLHVPSNVWGIDMLDDPSLNTAPQLWAFADNAGYQLNLHCNEGAEDSDDHAGGGVMEQADSHQDTLTEWKEKRVRRRFGNPFYCNPPVPVSPPFDTQWVELYIVAKKDEEKLPLEAIEFIQKNKSRKATQINIAHVDSEEQQATVTSLAGENGVNIITKFNGDIGAAVREGRCLSCEVSLKSIRWKSDPPERRHSHQPATKRMKMNSDPVAQATTDSSMMGREEEVCEARRIAKEAFENLNDYLMVAQRTCLERSLFAVIQSQAMRMLRELTYPLVDDESLTSVLASLKSRVASAESVGDRGVLIRPLMLSESEDIASNPKLKPNHLGLPVSWPCWPIMGSSKQQSPPLAPSPAVPNMTGLGRTTSWPAAQTANGKSKLHFLAARKKVTVTSADSDSVTFAFHEIPLFVQASKPKCPPHVAGECDILLRINFAPSKRRRPPHGTRQHKRRHNKQVAATQTADGQNPLFETLFHYLEEMSVCKLRHLFLETLHASVNHFPSLLFDLHPFSLPYTRRTGGPLLLNDFHSWFFSQVAMGFYHSSLPSKNP